MRRSMTCAVLMLSLFLTACEMRAEVSVNEDGSGTLGFVFGLEPMFARAFPPGTESPVDMFRDELKSSGAPWSFSKLDEPSLKGLRATMPFRDTEDLRERLEDLAEQDGTFFGSGDSLDTGIVLQQLDGGWSFRGRGVTPAGRDMEETGIDPSTMMAGMPEEDLNKAFRFEFHVTLPGQVLSHNADEIERVGDRTRFVWRTGMYDADALELRAQTEPVQPGPPIVPAAIVVLLCGGGALFLKRKPSGAAPPVVLEGMPVLPGSADAGSHEQIQPEPVGAVQSASEVDEQTAADYLSDLP